MNIAVLDIGSNAIRYQVSAFNILNDQRVVKKLEYMRFPISLGKDVFEDGIIKEDLRQRFIRLMQSIKLLNEFYNIKHFKACATSAFRDAKNADELRAETLQLTGIDIEVLSGDREAEILGMALQPHIGTGWNVHIDVGGGSTELNIYNNAECIGFYSFNVGSVRMLSGATIPEDEIKEFVYKHLPAGAFPLALATGGNITKLRELYQTHWGDKGSFTLKKLKEVYHWLKEFSKEELITRLELNPDRANVIVPAASIYISVMKAANVEYVQIPEVGLKDGILAIIIEKIISSLPNS